MWNLFPSIHTEATGKTRFVCFTTCYFNYFILNFFSRFFPFFRYFIAYLLQLRTTRLCFTYSPGLMNVRAAVDLNTACQLRGDLRIWNNVSTIQPRSKSSAKMGFGTDYACHLLSDPDL